MVWETCTCTLVASTVTESAIHTLAWDPQAFNEFVTAGEDGSVMFWLIDELTDTVPKLRVQQPGVPDDILLLSNKVSPTLRSAAKSSTPIYIHSLARLLLT